MKIISPEDAKIKRCPGCGMAVYWARRKDHDGCAPTKIMRHGVEVPVTTTGVY